jgi:hypothetical protein
MNSGQWREVRTTCLSVSYSLYILCMYYGILPIFCQASHTAYNKIRVGYAIQYVYCAVHTVLIMCVVYAILRFPKAITVLTRWTKMYSTVLVSVHAYCKEFRWYITSWHIAYYCMHTLRLFVFSVYLFVTWNRNLRIILLCIIHYLSTNRHEYRSFYLVMR